MILVISNVRSVTGALETQSLTPPNPRNALAVELQIGLLKILNMSNVGAVTGVLANLFYSQSQFLVL